MRCFLDGKSVPVGTLGLPAMNFGQVPPGARVSTYELVLSVEELLSSLGEHYARFAREMREDEKYDPEFEGAPELRRLSEAGYPALPTLYASDPGLLACLIQQWLYLEFLGALSSVPLEQRLTTSAAFNSIDAVVVGPGETRVRGRALR